jgi:hypothetical protein
MESVHQRIEFLGTTDFRIKRIVIYDVVSVHTARARLQNWREVDMTDAEHGKIGDNRCGVREPKVAVQLQTIGCAWDG